MPKRETGMNWGAAFDGALPGGGVGGPGTGVVGGSLRPGWGVNMGGRPPPGVWARAVVVSRRARAIKPVALNNTRICLCINTFLKEHGRGVPGGQVGRRR